jgi:multidrug efflux system membrane fusion protein
MRPAPVVVLVLVGLVAGCRGAKKPPAPAAVPVSVAKATTRDVPEQLEAVATVEPVETVSVTPEAEGRLVAIRFTEGQDVRAGDPLFDIDPRPYQAALAEAEGMLARDQATAENASLQAQRAERLAAEGLLSKQEHDQAIATATSSQASAVANAAAVQTARLNLAYTQIKAPIAGRTGSVLVHVGNVVKADGDQPLVVINRIDPIFVSFSVPEQRLAAIRAAQGGHGLLVRAVISGDPEPVDGGRLTFIDNQVDRATGTLRLKATFDNPKGRLWPGQFVTVRLTLGTQSGVVVIPGAAVQPGQKGTYLFVVKPDQTVEQRVVRTHAAEGTDVVVDDGVKAGETVVTDGQLNLTNGTRIQTKDAAAPAATGGGH